MNWFKMSLPSDLQSCVDAALAEWAKAGNVERLLRRDATLWTGIDESNWLGWLGIVAEECDAVSHFDEITADVHNTKFSHAVLLGMGGSSLGAEVFAKTFKKQPGYPELLVLDSTDPEEIGNIERSIDLARTLFIVSSKSGTTLEPNILKDYFFARAETVLGKGKAGPHFIAITDPGSKLEAVAKEENFRRVYFGRPDIGGRYSVLSDFGLIPAAIMGVDVRKLLESAAQMARSCRERAPAENPGVVLGAILGVLAEHGRDKVTIVASPGIASIGAWMEQLLAESTGKQGKGLIPLDGEPVAPPARYGCGRLFVYVRFDNAPDSGQDDAVAKLEQAGRPVVRIALADNYQLGQEFFRWEFATAVAGAILHINPFDQPDVEASKIKTRELMRTYEENGSLPPETPFLEERGIKLFADERNRQALIESKTLADALKTHFARIRDGNYFALLAYVAQDERYLASLQAIRIAVRDGTRAATCLGFGPRFLHSTGQAYKGGPDTGVFLQITADHATDISVPGHRYSFGAVIDATARGDFEVLNERGRRALRVHLGPDIAAGLATLQEAVRQALG